MLTPKQKAFADYYIECGFQDKGIGRVGIIWHLKLKETVVLLLRE